MAWMYAFAIRNKHCLVEGVTKTKGVTFTCDALSSPTIWLDYLPAVNRVTGTSTGAVNSIENC